MSSRELVMHHVADQVVKAFVRGDLIDAQNLDAFCHTLEHMTDAEYEDLVAEEISGAIS